MTDSLALPLAAFEGVLLGLFFFGGLWWTVRRAFDSPRPALWVGGSLLLRMGCTAGGFIFVSAGDWQRLLACLLGFIAARLIVTWCTGAPVERADARARHEAGHAS